MTQRLSTMKVSATLLLAALGSFVIPRAIPVISTLGDLQSPRSVVIVRVFGVLLVFVCIAGCFEGFRRGSNIDRFLACVAAVFGCLLAYEVFRTFFYTVVA